MKVSEFTYTNDWPVPVSDEFFQYLNTDIHGQQFFIEHQNIIFPFILKKKSVFKIGYAIHPPIKEGKKITLEEEKLFFKELQIFLKKNKMVDFILPPIHIENFQHIPSKSIGKKLGIIRLDIKDKTEEEVFSTFKPIYRNLIRKAMKENVEIKFGLEYFDDFYALYKSKLVLEGAPYDSSEQIKSMIIPLNEKKCVTCAVAYIDNKPDAGIVNINDSLNAYYLWAGTSDTSHAGSLRLLHWEIIRNYLKLGIENYRMGAARIEDEKGKHKHLLAFKMGFGSRIDEGVHFTFVVNKLKFKAYKILIALKTRIKK